MGRYPHSSIQSWDCQVVIQKSLLYHNIMQETMVVYYIF